MDAWLPTWADQYGIIGVGIAAVITGASGLVRRESGALSAEERQTPLGRMITPMLSGIWLIIGAVLLYTRFVEEPRRSDMVGYTAIIGSVAVLTTLVLALIYYALPLPNKRAATLEATPPVASRAAPAPVKRWRFRRHDAVLHPDHGRGLVLGSYANGSVEMVAVRFEATITSVPSASLEKQ